eukprot:4282630-Alexandrium_andersonii.AAC.1
MPGAEVPGRNTVGPRVSTGVEAQMSCLLYHSTCSTAVGSTNHRPRGSRMPLRREARSARRRPAAQAGPSRGRSAEAPQRRAGRSVALAASTSCPQIL